MIHAALVIVMQSVENWKRDNLSLSILFSLRCSPRVNFLLDLRMSPGLVEELNVFPDHAPQMALHQNRHVIKAFSPYAAHESFADGISFWRAIRRFHDFNSASRCDSREGVAVLADAESRNAECEPMGLPRVVVVQPKHR